MNRRLRARGEVPAVVYGLGQPPITIEVDRRAVVDLLKTASGENTVFLLRLADSDEQRHTMIRELQTDPIDHSIVHIDFQRIDLSEKVTVRVPVELVGEPEGVKNEGGMIDFVTRELEVECLPAEIPDSLQVQVDDLHVGDHVEAAAVALPTGVVLLDDPDRVIAAVVITREAVSEEEEAEELLEAEAEEPEVIGREEEEEQAEEGS